MILTQYFISGEDYSLYASGSMAHCYRATDILCIKRSKTASLQLLLDQYCSSDVPYEVVQ